MYFPLIMGVHPSTHVHFVETSLTFRLVCGMCRQCDAGFSACWSASPHIVAVHVSDGVFRVFKGCRNEAKRVLVRAGQAFIMQPGVPYAWGLESETGFIRKASIEATVLECIDLADLYQFPFVLDRPDATELGDAIVALKHSYAAPSARVLDDMIRRRCLGFTILDILVRNARSKGSAAERLTHRAERLLPVFRFVQNHLESDISREELAACVHLSPSRFNALFKDSTGLSPMAYVRAARLREAQKLLWSTELSIGEIADRFRFYDAFHFSKQFKKAFEVSPSEFRHHADRVGFGPAVGGWRP